jgi:3-oxoadipate enol-lactonase
MSREDDFDRGLENRRAVLGDAWVEQSLAGANAFNADFQSLITRYAWHDIWSRPGLDHTTRRLLVLGMTMGLGRWEEFELHCRAAVRGGVALEKIQETLLQGAIYCGVPAANTGFRIALQILRDEGLVPPPAPLVAATRVATHRTFSTPQLHVALQGEGAPVVLSHALGLDMAMWDAYAARLAADPRAGPCEVMRYDHRGHGASACPESSWSMDDLVDDAARLVREWGRGPVTWIGLSMGAMVGQGLAIRYPELVGRLVLANTTARYPESAAAGWSQRVADVRTGGMAAVADLVVARYLHPEFRAAHPEAARAVRDRLLRDDARGYAASCAAVAAVDWLDRLSQVRCPVLVIAGARDAGATPEMGQAIAQRIPGASLQVIENASHLSVVEEPGEFAARVSQFPERGR